VWKLNSEIIIKIIIIINDNLSLLSIIKPVTINFLIMFIIEFLFIKFLIKFLTVVRINKNVPKYYYIYKNIVYEVKNTSKYI